MKKDSSQLISIKKSLVKTTNKARMSSLFIYDIGGQKMDFAELNNYYVLVVVVACLIVGYILKTSFESFPNKYIPTVLAFTGLVLNLTVSGMSIENAVYGALMGLSSTGMHQAFTRFIEGNTEEK